MTYNTKVHDAIRETQSSSMTSDTIIYNPANQQAPLNFAHQWANALSNARYPVFPVKANEKVSAIKAWPKLASNECDAFREYWVTNPNANIGIHCKDLLVIDIDTQAGHGKNGYAWLSDLRIMVGDEVLCQCLCVLTPSGGLHLYFRLPDGIKVGNSAGKLAPGVDTRSDGGYVLAPGSMIDSKPYTLISLNPERLDIFVNQGENAVNTIRAWENNRLPKLSELPEAPPALLRTLKTHSSQASTSTGTVKPIKRPDTPLPEDHKALAKALSEHISAKTLDPDNEQDWFKVMAAGAHAVACWGWDEKNTRQTIFNDFCKLSGKFKENENLEKWNHTMQRAASRDVATPFTLRSIFHGTTTLPSLPEAEHTSLEPIVIAQGNTAKDQGWAKLVQFTNPDGEIVEVMIDLVDFAKPANPWMTKLRYAGYLGASSQKAVNILKISLMEAKPKKRFKIVRSIGWQNDGGFFVPDQINLGTATYRLEG
jgi:hypothetical protein